MNSIKDDLTCTRREKNKTGHFLLTLQDQDRRLEDLKTRENLLSLRNPLKQEFEDTTNICKELKDIKTKNFLEEKRRQQLHINNQELRTLQKRLQTAYVSQSLTEEKRLRDARKEEEKRLKAEDDNKRRKEWEHLKIQLQEEEEYERKKKAELRQDLQYQMSQRRQTRLKQYEMVMKDHEDGKDLAKKIQNEIQMEKEMAYQSRERYKNDVAECVRNKEIQEQQEREKNTDDTQQMLAYQREKDEMKEKELAKRKHLQQLKLEHSQRMGLELSKLNGEKKTRENLLLNLLVEERKAKEDERFRQMLQREVTARHKLREELDHYRNVVKIEKEVMLKEEDKRLRQQQMEYMAEQDKLEKLSDEKRRQKQNEHNKASRELIEINRKQKAQQITMRMKVEEELMENQKARDREIQEEKQRMLATLPPELFKFLPPH